MNDWERLHRQAERYKQSYPPGTRVMLLNMNDPYSPVESGMRGTVQSVDDIGQLLWVLHTLYMQRSVFGINGSALTHMFVKLTAR